jgi:hypothetical protein
MRGLRKGSEASGGRHGQPRPVERDVAGLLCGGRWFGKEVLWIAQKNNTGAPQVWVEAETESRVHLPQSTCMDF